MKNSIFIFIINLAVLVFDIAKAFPLPPYKREFFNPHSITVCRGQMRSIACPNLELIRIFNAFYGKLNGHDCKTAVPTKRDDIPTCITRNSPNLIKETCHGQQSCDLYAEDALYDNPCPGVEKYLYVSFTCQGKSQLNAKLQDMSKQNNIVNSFFDDPSSGPRQPALPSLMKPDIQIAQQRHEMSPSPTDLKTEYICTGQSRNIFCPELQLLKIKTAFYGKQKYRDCSGQYISRDPAQTCYSPGAFNSIKGMCEGQQSCDLLTEPNLYGKSTCSPMESQYLKVSYLCGGKSDLTQKLQNMNQIASRFTGSNRPTEQNYIRSRLPSPVDDKYYNLWKKWANAEEMTQWQRSAIPWTGQNIEDTRGFSMQIPLTDLRNLYGSYDLVKAAEKKADILQPIYQALPPLQGYIQQPSYPSLMSFAPNMAFQKADQRGGIIQPEIRQQLALPPSTVPYDPTVLGLPQNPARPCEGCNGDCSNYLCYGCGGCPAESSQKPHYMYPYQKQDSGYHDAFESHAMDLSGMIFSPVPPLPRHIQPKSKQRPGKSNTPDDDEDDDDDNDDDEDETESDAENDNDDDDTVDESATDNQTANQTNSKIKKTTKTTKTKRRNKKKNR